MSGSWLNKKSAAAAVNDSDDEINYKTQKGGFEKV
jgi:hypothetical protein